MSGDIITRASYSTLTQSYSHTQAKFTLFFHSQGHLQHVFVLSGTCVPTKPISFIYNQYTELNPHKSYFPCHEQQRCASSADDWRFFLNTPKSIRVERTLDAEADRIRFTHLDQLHSHTAWIVLNAQALSHYLDAESDKRMEACVQLHKYMHEYNVKYNNTKIEQFIFPSADEWIPYALIVLHSKPIAPSALSSNAFTHIIIERGAPSPLTFDSWDKSVAMPIGHDGATKRSLCDVLTETIASEGWLFFRKVSDRVVFPSNYIQQL
jgi:hypothetical protein